MKTGTKWIAARGTYAITRIEETEIKIPYIGTDGKQHGEVDGVKIVAFAGEVAVMLCKIRGNHPMTKANYRESMARKIQDAGGSWMGRSHATENAKADARIARMYDPRVTPSATDRAALRNAYYGGVPHPSDY